MLECLIWFIVWLIIAVVLLYVVEQLLGLWGAFPAAVPVLLRCLAVLIVLLLVLNCFGMLGGPVWYRPLR